MCQVPVTLAYCVFIVFFFCVFQVHLIEKQEMKRQVLKKRAEQTKEPRPSHVFFSCSHFKHVRAMCTFLFYENQFHGSESAWIGVGFSWELVKCKKKPNAINKKRLTRVLIFLVFWRSLDPDPLFNEKRSESLVSVCLVRGVSDRSQNLTHLASWETCDIRTGTAYYSFSTYLLSPFTSFAFLPVYWSNSRNPDQDQGFL